ncbi:uncharacterized protein TM35_000031800 [Trypanosoma theileri]|uniref:SPRY domain-containing protein n=1 Tax=Trypanosoma theileri TaxID=67003 RepID=A0A1X0P668_9TRYP|nr:uncharacterized protein TM35_000031800 [Trypanosoma theileri]ORC92427.1 hypothetical protein TM35_000031800 [Trypanosoma theileri]
MPRPSATPNLPSVKPLRGKTDISQQQQQRPASAHQPEVLVVEMDEEDEQTFNPEEIDVLTCSDEDFEGCLDYIKESTHRGEDLQPKKKGMKGYTKKQIAALYERLVAYHSSLVRASQTLHTFINRLEERIGRIRYDESLLHEYYRTLEESIERGEEDVLHRDNLYHRWQRELKRVAPRHRYAEEREHLQLRQLKLQDLLQEIETDMRDFAVNDVDDAALSREYRMGNTEGGKLEEVYEDAATVGSSPEARLRMRALRPLLQRVRELRILPNLPPSGVHSRLRKELILPFSARVLALKMDDGNNTGDRFVEWYVNAVIDPLALSQLVELVPRDYLVTTTVRLVNACDTCASLRQSQALPDVSHVVLQAIAEGRADAVASLILSSSGSYLRALESRENVAIIFYTALITGQIEVLRRLMSVGFYNTNALIVWLFLNPNMSDEFYVKYMKGIGNIVNKFMEEEARAEQDNAGSEAHRAILDDVVFELPHKTLDNMDSGMKITSLTSGLCEDLRRFLRDRSLYKRQVSISMGTRPNTGGGVGVGVRPSTLGSAKPQTGSPPSGTTPSGSPLGIRTTGRYSIFPSYSSDLSFSSLLSRKKLDRLLLSPIQCAVLPAVSTSLIRRVDPLGYTPLEGTTSHLLLVGDTSTANVHTVRLPSHFTSSWDGNESIQSENTRRRRKNQQADMDAKNLTFYYEAHISLKFMMNDVPISETPFSVSSLSNDENENVPMEGLQQSNVFVGWCTDACVGAADGRSTQPPLGSDCNSFGISFDVLHRWQKNSSTEEIILRPMKHTMGRTTPFIVGNEESRESSRIHYHHHNSGVEKEISLIRVHVEDAGLENNEEKDTEDDFTSTIYSSPIHRHPHVSPTPSPLEDSEYHTMEVMVTETVVPTVSLIQHVFNDNDNKEEEEKEEEEKEENTEKFFTAENLVFSNCATVIRGISVYKSLALVVGCRVNLGTGCASFTLNGTSLGVAFYTLPPALSLRPAVSLQASRSITSRIQKENPFNAVAVRFVFAQNLLLASHIITQQGFPPSDIFSSDVGSSKTPNQTKEDLLRSIPGALPITHTLLFDESMMNCALLRLLTCEEDSLSMGENDDEELLRGDKEALALGASSRVTTTSVRQMLNALSSAETMLFFPPVLLKRRSDDADREVNGVTIIPEDASLVPLCIALALRQRIPAYRIAVHPLTDFTSMDDVNIRQRRMAVLAAATLGYGEILHVLLERISLYEFLELFTIRSSEEKDKRTSSSMSRNSRLISSAGNTTTKRVASATMLHRVEYTPLHCAILEGHQDCVHLILYYLNETISEEYRRHALNVLTRSGETALLIACRLGYTDIAKQLLSMGAAPSSFDRLTRANCLELACASRSEEIAMMLLQTPDYHSYVAVNQAGVAPPLCWCALNNIGSLIRPLLENGANPNVTLDGPTPLLLAVSFGSEQAALELLNCCHATSNVALSGTSNQDSFTCSSQQQNQQQQQQHLTTTTTTTTAARSLKTNSMMGNKGVIATLDVDALDPRTQCAALHLACEQGQLEVVRALITKGASLNLQNNSTYANPLQMAIMNRHETLALDILEYAKDKLRRGTNVLDIASIEKNGDTALHLAAQEGLLQVIEYIMSQFSDEEITRLCTLRTFAKRPNAMSPVATNRQGRTPLLLAIHAHQEAAAQLIVSLMPEGVPNPGGPVIEGTCLAILSSDAEGLDNVTLFLLSQKGYVATDAFREGFFTRYNAKRLQMDLSEDAALVSAEEKSQDNLFPLDIKDSLKNRRDQERSLGSSDLRYLQVSVQEQEQSQQRRGTNVTARFLARASATMIGASRKLGVPKEKRSLALSQRRIPARNRSYRTESQRRRSTFVQMLLAKGGTAPSVRKSIQFLEQGFALEELYVMVDIISSETSRVSQSIRAMQYVEIITNFLREHGGVRVPSSDAVIFARKLLAVPTLVKAVEIVGKEEAKRKLLEMRPFCQEMINLIRTRGQHEDCVDEMQHMLDQRSTAHGCSFIDDVTSPFGFTALQLAASLGLPHVCDFLLSECEMDPLYVPQKVTTVVQSSAKWLATPFRLALRSLSVETVSLFLSLANSPEDLQKLLEHKELLQADEQQQTAVQEIIAKPIDSLSPGTAIDVLHLLRLLLAHGAVVQGNFDADGNDAWMLAVRTTPGKGTRLQIFLDEDVELGSVDHHMDNKKKKGSQERPSRTSTLDDAGKEMPSVVLKLIDKDGSVDTPRESHHNNDNESSLLSLAMSLSNDVFTTPHIGLPTVGMDSSHSAVHSVRARQKEGSNAYYAQLLFLCAEYNPQCLVSLLQQYSSVLSPSLFNPSTGDTLLIFLLRKAANIYAAECGMETLSAEMSHEDALQSTRRLFVENDLNNIVNEDGIPYRDPLSIPSVYRLLLVVEQLLRKFTFTNLYYEQEDGQTALALAARMSYTPLVGLIVRAESRRPTVSTLAPTTANNSLAATLRPSVNSACFDNGIINEKLRRNLESSSCWMILATRLYYGEEDMKTIMTILNNLSDDETKFSFLSFVYSNLHPILGIRLAAMYASNVRRFLMRAEAVNAFWCNVLYAHYAGRLEEVNVTSSEWSSILTVLLPTAPSIPIYIIKAIPSFARDSIKDEKSITVSGPIDINGIPTFSPKEKGIVGGRDSSNWRFIVKRTDNYVKQLSAAAVYIAVPPHVLTSLQTVNSGFSMTTAQRTILTAMAAHFHEIIELSVRFDNPTLMTSLISLVPEELNSSLKYEWRSLIEEHHFDVIAIAASSVQVLKFFTENPETAPYISINRYDRINPNNGIPEDLNVQVHLTEEPRRPVARGSVSLASLLKRHASETGSIVGLSPGRRNLDRQSLASIDIKLTATTNNNNTTKRSKEVKLMAVGLLGLDVQSGDNPLSDLDGTHNEDGMAENGMHYVDMLTAAKERETASAVTWGIGAATRPVALRENSKVAGEITSPGASRHGTGINAAAGGAGGLHRKRIGSVVAIADTSAGKTRGPSPTATPSSQQLQRRETRRSVHFTEGRRSTILPATITTATTRSSSSEQTRGRSSSQWRPALVIEPQEQPRYFPYFLCDWALHTTLLLHSPKPSAKTIDILLSLLDKRAPLTPSAVQIFLAASRPVNRWESSEGELLTLSYTTRTHKDTILHLLVQNDQVQLTRYFLAAALCYFTCYQYDPPTTVMPPEFPSIEIPKTETQEKNNKTNLITETDDTKMNAEEESSHPAVFLRSMLRMNKYGLTPFDYARGQMISVLTEYGCVPPSYRPNPQGFCRAIRLTTSHTLFYSVPRLLLVSDAFTKLHDEGSGKHSKRVMESKIKDVPDATIIRNQTISHRSTRVNVLPNILTDNVSLLHLGLCSADDELVIQSINEKRQSQLKRIVSPHKGPRTPVSQVHSSLPTTSRASPHGVRVDLSWNSSSKNMTNTFTSNATNSMTFAGIKIDKDLPNAFKLLDVLRERGFVTFPLLLPLIDEFGQPIGDSPHSSDTAILLSMTPMMIAHYAGIVKREDGSAPPVVTATEPPAKKKKGGRGKNTGTESITILPRFTPGSGTINGRHPADVLDTWVTTRRTKTKGTARELQQHPQAHVLIRVLGTGVAGRTIRLLGLTTAPSYEQRN